jgi:molybdopterin molybdotransferase
MTPEDKHRPEGPAQAMPALSVEAALAELARWALPVAGTEELGLFDALDRVLAQDLVSPISVPPHDNSAMDGYAFDGAQLRAGQPLLLRPVGGVALAGQAWDGQVAAGQCLRIMTGAVMPAGLDTVVPQELTRAGPDGAIVLPADSVCPGDNRRLRGEDLKVGEPALRAGERLGPAALGLLASLGLERVCVRRRLRVACFSTGDELLRPGEPPRPGAIYDSNRYTLFGLLTRLGAQVMDLGVVRDEPAALEATLRAAAAQADVVITSGGVSVGDADHTRALMQRLGEVVFRQVALRPGRPLAVGRLDAGRPAQAPGCLLLGLPGNPVAAMVAFLALVRPTLLAMMGVSAAQAGTPLLQARCQEALRKKPGRTEYQRGIVERAPDGQLRVRSTGHQGSGVLSSMHQANGLIVLRHEQGAVAAGDLVDVMLLNALT